MNENYDQKVIKNIIHYKELNMEQSTKIYKRKCY